MSNDDVSVFGTDPLLHVRCQFFKETESTSCLGMPTCLMIHLVLSCVSMFSMWLGIIATSGNGGRGVKNCEDLKNRPEHKKQCLAYQGAIFHSLLGTIAIILYHVTFIGGWYPPKMRVRRWIALALHSIGGYATLAALCVYTLNKSVCQETDLLVGLLIIVSVIFFFCGTGIQVMQDVKMGEKFRSWIPVLEGIKIWGKAPLAIVKVIAFVAGAALHFLMFFLVLSSYQVLNANDANERKMLGVTAAPTTSTTFDPLHEGPPPGSK